MEKALEVVASLIKRSFWLTGVLVFVAIAGLASGAYLTQARGPDDQMPGTSAPGSHEWWTHEGADVYNNFCYKCHAQIKTEVTNTKTAGSHPLNETCLSCHGTGNPRGSGAHVAAAAKCVDCHANRGQELTKDAHSSFLTQLGETATTASWTCKACHTKVTVNMTVTPRSPLQLKMGP